MAQLKSGIIVYLPDTRAVEIARYGSGNTKIGFGVFTYSRIAGNPALYSSDLVALDPRRNPGGTCPGSTPECEAICYAKRIAGPVREVYASNTGDDVPPIPEDCRILRIHVSGDFNTVAYIRNWVARLKERPDVTCWAYTRSWRVAGLLHALEELRALPNVQLFASMDESHTDVPPAGWRRAWIDGDVRGGLIQKVAAHEDRAVQRNIATFDGTMSLVCPEETKHKANCLECGYCFEGQKNDVTFLKH